MPERWLAVVDYVGAYEISSWGDAHSIPRIASDGRHLRGVTLKQHLRPDGYFQVTLSLAGVVRPRLVHHLVAEAFIGPRPEGMEIRHLDGVRTHNWVENLAYGTHADNMQDMLQHGMNPRANATHCPAGHLYDEANTYWFEGRRHCIKCNRVNSAAYAARKRAEREPQFQICPQCGITFEKPLDKRGAQKYCTRDCYKAAMREMRKRKTA